jgi:hypothetical protein
MPIRHIENILSKIVDKKITLVKFGQLNYQRTIILELDNSSFLVISGDLGSELQLHNSDKIPEDFNMDFQITNQKV